MYSQELETLDYCSACWKPSQVHSIHYISRDGNVLFHMGC